MYKQVIKEKLRMLGYYPQDIDQKIEKINSIINFDEYTESDFEKKIEVIRYETPSQEIPKFYLNREGCFEEILLLEGRINLIEKIFINNKNFIFADFPLSDNLLLVGITNEKNIKILLYLPNDDTIINYTNRSYEDAYAEERKIFMEDCVDSLFAKKILTMNQVLDIVVLLASDYILDKMIIEHSNPKFKLYSNAKNFAETITNYKYKYIDTVDNSVKKIEKNRIVKCMGKGVIIGNISNEPYLKLSKAYQVADFYLNTPSYVWFSAQGKGLDELAIYTAKQEYIVKTYREWLKTEDKELRAKAEALTIRFSNECGYSISMDFVLESLKKLNRELVILPTGLLKNGINVSELPEYRYRATTNPEEFENTLYNLVEENLNGRYKYRLVENVNGLYTMIGNKIEYTDMTGEQINKQTIADFNKNASAVVIKRETFLPGELVSQYRNNEMNESFFENSPIPILEVIFYFPKQVNISDEVSMYNGSNIEYVFHLNTQMKIESKQSTLETLTNSKINDRNSNLRQVRVKYITSQGKILKETIVGDLLVGSNYVPNIIPVIKDEYGREWIYEANQMLNTCISENYLQNEIEIKYEKRMANVQINYITQSGEILKPSITQRVQIGEVYLLQEPKTIVDNFGLEWILGSNNLEQLIVSEKEENNRINLVYGNIKVNVFLSYLTTDGIELKNQEKVAAVVNENFTPNIIPTLLDEKGLSWKYIGEDRPTIHVEKSENNKITFLYEKQMQKVRIQYIDEDANNLKEVEIKEGQVGDKIIIEYEQNYIDHLGRSWKAALDNKNFVKVSEIETENVLTLKYLPVLENVTILFQDQEGNELKNRKIVSAQVGTEFEPKLNESIKDKKGNEWKIVGRGYKPILVKDNERENVISYIYEVARAKVSIKYLKVNGEELKPEEHLLKQVGSGMVPTPEPLVYDNENLCWKLSKIQPAMLKVADENNEITVVYEEAFGKITWKYLDVDGNELREKEIQRVQIGKKYSPLIKDRVIYKSVEVWKLMEIRPYEIVVSENDVENIIELIYSNAK